MAALNVKADIENELQLSLPASYTDAIITGLCEDANAELQDETNRSTFTGTAARRAKRAELLLIIDYLTTSNRDLTKLAISSMGEAGANVSFSTGKTISSHREEANKIMAKLRLPATQAHGLTFIDNAATHTSTDPGMFDEVED